MSISDKLARFMRNDHGWIASSDIQRMEWRDKKGNLATPSNISRRLPASGGSRDRTGLRRKSLQNGNFRGQGRRLSAISLPRLGDRESGDKVECAKSRDFRPVRRRLRTVGSRRTAWLTTKGSNSHIPDWNRAFEMSCEFRPIHLFSSPGDFSALPRRIGRLGDAGKIEGWAFLKHCELPVAVRFHFKSGRRVTKRPSPLQA
jgi:hypothetical protein